MSHIEQARGPQGRRACSLFKETQVAGNNINHSCRPNAEAFVTGRRVWVWSKKSIKAGEQITLDYGEAYFNDYIRPKGCRCEKCRPR